MPKVSYTTFLDTYLWWCFGFLAIVTAENSLVFRLDVSEQNEIYVIIVIAVLWLLFNVVEVIRGLKFIISSRISMEQKEKSFQQHGITSK